MEIIKTNIDQNNKKLVYKLTKSSGMMVQDVADRLSVPVSAWALYNDPKENKDGTQKENKVLSFLSVDGTKFSTVSATFIREFLEIAEIMGEDAYSILIVHGTTKGGKPFCTCELDCDY